MDTQDTTSPWLKKSQSSASQRKVDKELQRIKSLAVVSVLNKNFQDTAPPLPPTMSPSSSLTTSNSTSEQASPSNYKTRSHSISHTIPVAAKNTANRPVSTIPLSSSPSKHEPSSGQKSNLAAEKQSSHDDLVIRSHIDSEKQVLQMRLAELQNLYDQSHQQVDQLKEERNTQCQLLLLQDKLIQEMTDHIEELNTNSPVLENDVSEVMAQLPKAQEDLKLLQTELDEFMPLKSKYESLALDMTHQLDAYDQKMDEIEKLAREIQKESQAQTLYIDAKVQTLVNKLLERNEFINKLQYEYHTERQMIHAPRIDNTSNISTKSAVESTNGTIWEQYTHEFSGGGNGSTRSSMVSTDTTPSKIHVSRWKGNAIPPASPPPSLPLPPIPSSSSISRPKSTLSEISEYSNTNTNEKSNKHVSVDAVGGTNLRRPSHQSEKADAEPVSAAEAAYYQEFTEQLHARLAISKEIDDLRVWEPSDFEDIQKKLQSKYWPEEGDGVSEKDQHAFWKGMKKKLRV